MFPKSNLALSIALSVSSVLAANIEVSVGKGGLVFDPPSIKAAVGDTVTYKFFPKVSHCRTCILCSC